MITNLMPVPKQQFFTNNGLFLVGGKVYTYAAGGNIPKDTYTDSAGTIAHANPIILNARGEPASAIYWSGSYRVEVQDALGNLIYSVDNYNTDPSGFNGIIATFASAVGAAMIGFLQFGVNAVLRTVQSKLRDVVSVKDFGAKGDWNGTTGTDDSAAFQAAINAVALAGGGTVTVPPVLKAYRINAPLVMYPGVSLIGDTGRNFLNFLQGSLDGYYGRHCLAITWGSNSTNGMAIEMRPTTNIAGLNFIYPGQVTSLLVSAPIPFPPTIGANEGTCPGGSVVNCNFVNSYRAVYIIFGHGNLLLRGLWGTPLGDFITLNGSYNADQVIDCNVSGIFYLNQDPNFNFTNNTGLLKWIQANGKAFVIGYADAIRFSDCFVGNCGVGMYMGGAPAQGGMVGQPQFPYGSWTGGGMEGVTICFQVNGGGTSGISSNGFRVSDAGIAPVALFAGARALSVLWTMTNTTFVDATEQRGKITFTNCGFWGTGNWQTNCGPLEGVVDATGGDIEFYGCTFKVWQSYIARVQGGKAMFKFVGCDFLDNRALSGNLYHFVSTSAVGTLGRFFVGSGNDFKGYFGSNFVANTAEVYETRQNYTFTAPALAAVDPIALPAIGSFFTIANGGSASFMGGLAKDREVTLAFAGVSTLNDGGNLKLSSNFTSTGDDTITLISDGLSWYEKCRSVN